jgi:hypothetical protein
MAIRLDPQATVVRVRAAATGNLTLSGPQTIDGVSVVAGDLVWAPAQSSATTRALYLVQSEAWVLVDPGLSAGLLIVVLSGSTLGGRVYRITNTFTWGSGTPTIVEDASAAGAVTTDGVQTLTNKTLTNPTLAGQTPPSAAADVVALFTADANGAATAGLGMVFEGGGTLLLRMLSAAGAGKVLFYDQDLEDDAILTLPVLANGGWILVGGDVEGGLAKLAADGSVAILCGSTNFVSTNDDAKLCVYDGGASANLRNRLGATKRITALLVGS